jgi:23S rRNA (cytidine1920-2'-O)/16S rRNA (cytidine1409-2'-O)-methyltransferase
MKKNKKRLDILVLERHPEFSKNYVQSIIMQGKVLVDDKPCTKPGTLLSDDVKIDVKSKIKKYVSRAGLKLEKALDHFNVNVKDLIVLDSGISTGGFTDCLLQRGAKRVYGIDVGYGQVHEKIRSDKRVIIIEKTNLRYFDKLPELVDLVTLDITFISILTVMPAVAKLIKPDGKIITLIKPQFEAKKNEVGIGGIVRDEEVYKRVIEKIKNGMMEFDFKMADVIESPILGAKGNREFLALFLKK